MTPPPVLFAQQWLATNRPVLSSAYHAAALDFTRPDQQALVAAVERWLAVTGTGDAAIDGLTGIDMSSQRSRRE